MQEQKAIHIKAENFDGCMAFVVELGKMLTEKEITMATIERSHGDMVKITTYRSNEAYTFSSHKNQDGIKMDITIKTEQDMVMPTMLARYAALSHGVYLDMARDISEHKRRREPVTPEFDDKEKIIRLVGNGAKQEWYGVKENRKGLACARCNSTNKAKTILVLHRANWKEIIWQCECGNYIVSITHTANHQDQ